MHFIRPFGAPASATMLALAGAASAKAPPAPAAPAAPAAPDEAGEIVVRALRGSAVTDLQPLATFDRGTLEAIGASDMSELLRALRAVTQSADGSEPIFLLNAQRVSGYSEIGSLPPEAIEKIEVLPEPAALKYGYPPTRRVVNFITKRRFQQLSLRGAVGASTRGGAATASTDIAVTRLADDRRLTLTLERRHTDPLLVSQRHILPDPDVRFDAIGNVTGTGGGEIDPALSALAGQPVIVAPVPVLGADRSLAGFAVGANRPRLFGLGSWRSLTPRNDATKGELVVATPVTRRISASISLSAEQSRDERRSGPAPLVLTVPAANPHSPFGRDVTLNRYLTEIDPLHEVLTTTTLHGGILLRGAFSGWRWDLGANLDQVESEGRSERAIDPTALNQAIAAGADPFGPFDPSLLSAPRVDRGRLRTRTAGLKSVVTSRPVKLPAGEAIATFTVEAERASADSVVHGPDASELHIGRTRREAGLSVDVPLASRRSDFLPFVGELSVNGSALVRQVGGFGTLDDLTYGLGWSPLEGVQLLASVKRSEAAPGLEQLSSPVLRLPNAGVFDYRNGRTEIVTLVQGGNPDLKAERRRVRSLTLSVKPIARRDLRLSATYEATSIRDPIATLYAITPRIEQLLPGLVTRDVTGRLTSVSYRPVNLYRERTQVLNLTIASNGPFGKAPPPPPPGGKPAPRANYYAGIGPGFRFADRVELRPGTEPFDLVRGDTISGRGTPRIYGYAYGGIGYLGNGVAFNGWYAEGTRVRSDDPAADLRISPVFRLNMNVYLSVHHFTPHETWTSHLQFRVDVQNLTGNQPHVRDRNGRVPNRYQSDYAEPIGRSVKLTLRKLF